MIRQSLQITRPLGIFLCPVAGSLGAFQDLKSFTLGFFVDSAFADIRFDRAVLLIAITACLNIAVDALSRAIRTRLRLKTTPDQNKVIRAKQFAPYR